MTCQSCREEILYHAKNVCPKCGGPAVVKPKAKMGRPRIFTTAQRKEKAAKYDREWRKKNADRRRVYQRDRARTKRGVVIGQFVVENDGLFKRNSATGKRWDTFELAKIYASKSYAEMACRNMGKGKVVDITKGAEQ